MALVTYYVPPTGLPDLSTTYARWSAAEADGGGLDAAGNWLSVYGDQTLLRNANAFTYSASALNGAGGLVTPAAGGSFYLPAVTLPNDSAALILVLRSTSAQVQVVAELEGNTNLVPETFGIFIEDDSHESYLNVAGGRVMYARRPQVMTPFVSASRFYLNPQEQDFTVNGISTSKLFEFGIGSASSFGTKPFYIFSRANGQFFGQGELAAVHLFHTAPDALTWTAWQDHYRERYRIA